MKKSLTILFVIAMFMNLSAQVEVNSTGKVGIGKAPVSNFNLATNTMSAGNSFFGYNSTYPYMIIAYEGYYQWAIKPSRTNNNYVGTSSLAFKKMYSYDFVQVSDKRHKENFRTIEDPLKKVLKLQGLKYDIKKEFSYDETFNASAEQKLKLEQERKNRIGFLAQDVYKILPEVVDYNEEEDVYAVNYTRVVPVMIEALKEQQLMIEKMQKEIIKLKSKIK